jgi:quinol monooxygenase YgiN
MMAKKVSKKQLEARSFLRFKALEDEGLDYAIRNYSNWEEIDSSEFHLLQSQYTEAANALEAWIKENCPECEPE